MIYELVPENVVGLVVEILGEMAQWTIKKMKQAWSSFFGSMKSWKKQPERFLGMPKPPKYREKMGNLC